MTESLEYFLGITQVVFEEFVARVRAKTDDANLAKVNALLETVINQISRAEYCEQASVEDDGERSSEYQAIAKRGRNAADAAILKIKKITGVSLY